MQFNIFATVISIFFVNVLNAQLDSKHWIPPMASIIQEASHYQYLYISTPSDSPIEVQIKDSFDSIIGNETVSKNNPAEFQLPRPGDNPQNPHIPLISISNLTGGVYFDKGVIVEGNGDFTVNYRVEATIHAGAFLTKGRAALGRAFRIGHNYTNSANGERFNFVSFISTEDNTVVTVSGLPSGLEFTPSNISTSVPLTVNLPEAGNSYIIALKARGGDGNDLIGSLVTSNKPIAVNCGSWVSSPSERSNMNDIGIEQVIPTSAIGNDYILMRGRGPGILETPIVVCHYDNTKIYLNGESTPYLTLNSGEFEVIPSTFYSSSENMYIHSDKPIYVYQSTGGENQGQPTNEASGGLNLVTPLVCSNLSEPDFYEIPSINFIGDEEFSVDISILKKKNANLIINNGSISIGSPYSVEGNSDFEVHKINNLFGNVSITSNHPTQINVVGGNDFIGYSSYYAYSNSIELNNTATLTRRDGCQPILVAETDISGKIEWYLNDELINGVNTSTITATSSGTYNFIVTYQSGCSEFLSSTSNSIHVDIVPELSIDSIIICEASFNLENATIDIFVSGGNSVYTYTLNNQRQNQTGSFVNLSNGEYLLKVQDSFGCEISSNISINPSGTEELLYPNPTSDILLVNTNGDAPESSSLDIVVFDAIGRKVINLMDLDKGPNGQFEISLSSLSSGTYFVCAEFHNFMDQCGRIINTNVLYKIIKVN